MLNLKHVEGIPNTPSDHKTQTDGESLLKYSQNIEVYHTTGQGSKLETDIQTAVKSQNFDFNLFRLLAAAGYSWRLQ